MSIEVMVKNKKLYKAIKKDRKDPIQRKGKRDNGQKGKTTTVQKRGSKLPKNMRKNFNLLVIMNIKIEIKIGNTAQP